ncbi:MAG: tetratricopeptide repeat protein [Phycisphaerales bacterium JB059]
MHCNSHALLLKLSAVIGLLAGIGVFAAGVLQSPEPAGVTQPETSEAQQAMARGARAMQIRDWASAIEAFERARELEPSNAAAAFNLAYSVHATGDMERAIPLHEDAARFESVRGVALYNLGCAHARLGNTDEAFGALGRAVEAGFKGNGGNFASVYEDPDLASVRADERFEALFGKAPVDDRMLLRFWVGAWDCYSATSRKLVGTNELTVRNSGHAILEHWEASGGTSGESWNWYDPASGTWNQVWVDQAGGVITFTGRRQGDGILFEGVSSDEPGATQRMHVRPIAGGRVQQTGTTSTDGGKTWTLRYDLIYVPRGQALDGEE